MTDERDTVVILSGGMDSAVLLAQEKRNGTVVEAITFDYGQRHRKEIEYADAYAFSLGVTWHLITLPLRDVFAGSGSSQVTDEPVPHGHYAEENMKKTVVPHRNLIMLSLAAARARSIGAKWVSYAAHAGDHTIYPDCRPEFVSALNKLLAVSDWEPIGISAPFLALTKGDIAAMGVSIGVPFEHTWSCYEGGLMHCGKCGACTERKEAFAEFELDDPTIYADG